MSDNPTIDPFTGLEIKDIKDPFTGLPFSNLQQLNAVRQGLSKQPEQINPSTGYAMSTGDFSDYSSYGVPVSATPFDYEELRAQNQSIGQKYLRGFGKMGVTAASSFVNTMTGMLGMVDWGIDLIDPNTTADLAATQAKFARAIDTEKWREAARESMPHYYTKEELQNVGTLGGMFTANFVSDKLFDGLGFFLGTAAATMATGGFSLLGKIGQAGKVSQGLAAWRAGTALRSGASVSSALNTARQTKFWASKIGGKAAYLESSMYSALGESALEARETGRVTFERLKKAAEDKKEFLGLDPNLTPQELQQVKLQAMEAEGAAFYGNLAALTASNAIMLKGILRPFNKAGVTSKFLRATTKAERAAGKGNVIDKLADLPGGIRQVAQAERFLRPLTTRAITEGTEEATQFAIQEGIADYQMDRMSDSGLGDLVESLIDTNKFKALQEALPNIAGRGMETFSNPESREQFIIGSLIGIIGGTSFKGGALSESRAKLEQRDAQKEIFDNPLFYKIAARGESINAESTYLKAMNRAQEQGDQKLYEYYQKRLQTAQILRHYETGSLDLFRAMMEDSAKLEDSEFKSLFGFDENETVDKQAVVKEILERADEIERSAAYVDELFSLEHTRGAARLFMSEEQKQAEDEAIKDQDIYKFFLKQELGTVHMVDGQIRAKVDKMKEIFPEEDLTIPIIQKDGRVRIVNMENRLKNYARNRFGVVSEGKEGAEDIAPDAPKLKQNLAKLLEQVILKGDPEKAALFAAEARDLITLIETKDNAASALRNLMRDPETRDLAISRAKMVERIERQRKRDAIVDTAIEDTQTPEELEAKMASFKANKASEEAISKAEAEIRERKKTRSDAIDKWDTMSKTAVAAETDLSPMLSAARDKYLEGRPQEEPLVNTVEEARKNQAARQAAAGQQTPTPQKQATFREGISTSTSGKEDAILTTVEGKRELVMTDDNKFVVVNESGEVATNDIHKERTLDGKPIITNPELLNTEDTAPGAEVELVVIEDDWWVQNKNNPQYKNEPENIPIYVKVPGKGIVGVLVSNNSPLRHTVYNAWKEGGEQSIVSHITKESLDLELTSIFEGKSLEDLLTSTGVGPTQELSDDDVGRKLLDLIKEDKFEVPIEEVVNSFVDNLTLFLQNGKTYEEFQRFYSKNYGVLPIARAGIAIKQIYNRAVDSKGGIKIKIAEKLGNNRNNARVETEQGLVPYFSNVAEVFRGQRTPIGVVGFDTESVNKRGIRLGNMHGLSQEEAEEVRRAAAEAVQRSGEKGLFNVRFGQVLIFHKNPSNKWTFSVLATAKLNKEEQDRAFELLKNADEDASYEELVNLVGLNLLEPEAVDEFYPLYLSVDPRFIEGTSPKRRMIRFALPQDFLKELNLEEVGSVVGAIDSEALRLIQEDPTRAAEILKDKKRAGNLIQSIVEIEGYTEFQGSGYDVATKEQLTQLLVNSPEIIKNLLAEKRRQVSIADLDADPGYLNDLANEEHSKGADDTAFGHKGVISTDLVAHNGSVFHGIGMRFADKVTVNGKEVNIRVAPISAPRANTDEKRIAQSNEPKSLAELIAANNTAASTEQLVRQSEEKVASAQQSRKIVALLRLNQKGQTEVTKKDVGLEQIAEVQEKSKKIIRPGAKNHPGKTEQEKSMYYDTETKTYHPRVSLVVYNGRTIDNASPALTAALDVGNMLDEAVRQYVSGETVTALDTNISGLAEGLEAFAQHLIDSGETVVARDLIVPNVEDNLYGEIDLLTVDENGVFRIYDMKTMKDDWNDTRKKGDNIGQNIYETPYYNNKIDSMSKQTDHSRQLSLYRIALAKQYGIVAEQGTIIGFKPKYKVADIIKGEQPTEMQYLGLRDIPLLDVVQFTIDETEGSISYEVTEAEEQEASEEQVEKNAADLAALIAAEEKKKGKGPLDLGLKDEKDDPFATRAIATVGSYKKMNRNEARKWLRERNMPVEFYDAAIKIGSLTVHGYFKNGAVHLWHNAEVGTEYHEAFHYTFRILLNDEQREQLYAEARIKYNLPNATNLQLEEEMAEDFRDYVFTAQQSAKGIKGKIIKFFKDLYNYIKILVSGKHVGIEQIYSLIESNKIPAKFERNTETLQPKPGEMVTRLVSAMDANVETQNMVVDSISTIFKNEFDKRKAVDSRKPKKMRLPDETIARLLLGQTKENRGEIAEFFLKRALSQVSDGQLVYASDEAFNAFVKAKTPAEKGLVVKKYGLKRAIPMYSIQQDGSLDMDMFKDKTQEEKAELAKLFYTVWNNWFDVVDERTGNIEDFGFREAVILDLKRFGFSIRTREKIREEIETDNEALAHKEETNYDKIYAISSMEIDPIKTVSQEVRRAFSEIVNTERNSLGFQTYINVEDALRATLAVAVGSSSYEEIVGKIQFAVQVNKEGNRDFDVLAPIAEYLAAQKDARGAAAIRRFLTKEYSEQRIIMEEMLDDEMRVKHVNSDRKSATIGWLTTWKGESIETLAMDGLRSTALMKENPDKTLSFHNNTLDGKTRLQHIQRAYALYNNADNIQDKVNALADLMWYSSLGMASTKNEAANRLNTYFNQMNESDQQLFAGRLLGSLTTVLNKVITIPSEGGVVKPSAIKPKETIVDPFISEGSTIKKIAEIAAEFNMPVAIAYVNAMGKTIYPYNLPTPFTELLNDLKKGRNSSHYQLMLQDLSMSMKFGENTNARALMLYLIEKGDFEIESFSLDALMNEVTEDTEDYRTMGDRNSMIMRINMFLNQGSDYSYIAIPTQETRQRVDFLKLPKFGDSLTKSMVAAGIPRSMLQGKGMRGMVNKSAQRVLLANVILRDLVRLSLDPKLYREGGDTNFHLTGIENTRLASGRLSDIVQDAMSAKNKTEYQEFFDEIYRQVDRYMDEVLKPNREALFNQLVEYNIIKESEEGSGVYEVPEGSRIDSSGRKRYQDVKTMLASYMFTDLIARIEMAQTFRGGIQNSKNTAAFYKRMGLINTPGDKFMIKGEFKGNPEYGMNPVLRTVTVVDYLITDPYHDEIADKIFRMERDALIAKGMSPEKAGRIAEQYRRNPNGEYSDGQAWISPTMFKWIEQGLARWREGADDAWFDEYMNGGKWGAEYTAAFKFYFEQMLIRDGHMVPNMDKNSYVVLTREFVAGNPALEAMLAAMEKNDIHIVNSLSAKKGYKGQPFNPYNEDGSLKTAEQWDAAVIEEIDARKLFMPQIINDKQSSETKMNRQIRKTVPSMVNSQVTYKLPDGTEMLGADLLNQYHDLHTKILAQQKKKLFDELGWNEVKADPLNPDVRLDFLKRFREMIMDNLTKNDKIDINVDKQLRIVEDLETQRADFNVPIEMPVYERAYSNLIQSLVKSNVYTVKMPGAELVQVAGPGTWNITETDGTVTNRELRHLDIKETTDKDGNVTARELIHSEILISADLAERLGLKVGDTGVAYRIPMQDYSSAVPSRIAGILPEGYTKTIVVAGNIIVQTGSDFDIDKLFALFRNSNENLTQLQKDKNALLDLVEAVLTNAETMPYLFNPLNQDTLNALADDARYAGEYGAQSVAFDDPLAEVKMESNYKSAATLVGAYANATAGLNVATRAAQQSLETEGQGIILNSSKHFTLNGRLLNQIQMISPMDGERTLDGVVERLSAALDAATKLIHSAINDNSVTVNATVFLKSIGFPEEDIVALLTTPAVRKFVELKRNNPKKGLMTLFMEAGLDKDEYKLIRDFDIEAGLPVVNREELQQITAGKEGFFNGEWTGGEEGRAYKAFAAFAHAYVAGSSLSKFYEVIAPDNMDGMGDLAEVSAYLDVLENYEAKGDKNIVGYSEVEKILRGDAYGTMRGFFSTMEEVMELQSYLFLGNNASVMRFKTDFKALTGRPELRGQDHRFLNRALNYHIITKEGSPLGKFLRKDVVKEMLIDEPNVSKGNLFAQVRQILEDNPRLGNNRMLTKIVESPGFNDEANRVWGIAVENTEKMTNLVKNATIRDFEKLLFEPEIYTEGMENAEEENRRIKNLATRLVVFSIITTGLAPSYGSYYTSIPIDWFINLKDDSGTTLVEYLRDEYAKMRNDEAYFDDFMFDFIQNYGTTTVSGVPLISRAVGFRNPNKDGDALVLVPKDGFDITESEIPVYATFRQGKKGVDKISVYEFDAEAKVYKKIHSLGIGGKIIEMNLRDANGEIVRTSFWADKGKDSKIVKIKVPGKKDKSIRMESRMGLTKSNIVRPKTSRPKTRPSKNNDIDQEC